MHEDCHLQLSSAGKEKTILPYIFNSLEMREPTRRDQYLPLRQCVSAFHSMGRKTFSHFEPPEISPAPSVKRGKPNPIEFRYSTLNRGNRSKDAEKYSLLVRFALRRRTNFAYSRTSPNTAVNQPLQTEPSTKNSMVRPSSAIWGEVPLWQASVLTVLCLWLYWSTLLHLVGQWWSDPNFSHGFFVPLFSAFVIWQERERFARVRPHPSWSGVVVLLAGLGLLVVGRMGAELFLDRSSLLLVLAGVIILLLGWNLFRALLFPWAFLLLMIPIPTILFNQITFPLQLLASKAAAAVLPLMGVPILREGNVINLPSMALEVAEACSGIRSLMSLVTLAIMYGYLMEKRLWVRWLLAIASVPIAVAANSFRIIGTGLLVQYWDTNKAEGYFHASWGWIIFVISLILLYAVHGMVRFFFPEKGGES